MANFKTSAPNLFVKEIQDQYLRSNFQNLFQYFLDQNQLLDFKFFDLTFSGAETRRRVPHGLNRIPSDLIRLQVTGPGKITFHRADFDSQYLLLSSLGEGRVRFYAGSSPFSGAISNSTGDEVWLSTPLDASDLTGFPSKYLSIGSAVSSLTLDLATDLYLLDATSAPVILTLLPAADTTGLIFRAKKQDVSANAVVLTPVNGELIDGATTKSFTTSNQVVTFTSDGENWVIL